MKILFLLIALPIVVFSAQSINDDLRVKRSLTVDSTPTATNPKYFLVRDSTDTNKVKKTNIDSLLDTVPYAIKAGSITSGTDSSYIPFANTDTTFGTSTAKMAGDTLVVFKEFAAGDTFVNVGYYGLSSYASKYGLCTAPNDDVFTMQFINSNRQMQINRQAGGSGSFSAVDTIDSLGWDISSDADGNIHVISYITGKLYKSSGGITKFDSIWDFGAYNGYASDDDTAGNVYVVGDDVYKMNAGEATFTALATGLSGLRDITGLPNGDMLITNGSGDVYRLTYGTSTPINEDVTPPIYWICTDISGNVYGDGSYGYIWMQAAGIGDFYLFEDKLRAWGAMTCLNDGTLRNLNYSSFNFWERDATPEITSFHVKQGASILDGSVDINGELTVNSSAKVTNTPTVSDPDYLICKKDNDILKKCLPESLTVDSARVAGNVGIITETVVVSDSLFLIVGTDTFFIETKK